MTSILCLTLRFLDPLPRFHGRGDDGNPEWPPSPLRLFQALVCASASRWRADNFRDYAQPALQWLETIQPLIITPQVSAESFGYRMYVPNNSGDLMTAAWARRDTETSMAKFRVEKDVRPTCLTASTLHYLFPLADDTCPHFEVLAAAARSITHLGWGIDMVAGDAKIISSESIDMLPGERWQPNEGHSRNNLRVPVKGTLDDLTRKHTAFMGRLGPDGFKPVPPLSAYRVVGYRREIDPAPRPFAAFSILKPDASGFRAFDPTTKTHIVAGMVRHAAASTSDSDPLKWPLDKINTFIHGHSPDGSQKGRSEDGRPRFSYLPLPTLGTKGGGRYDVAGNIRRVMMVAPAINTSEVAWTRRALSGQELIDEQSKQPVALLSLLPTDDYHVKKYTSAAEVWDTVSPVVLPGFDSTNEAKVEKLLRQSIRQAGFAEELAKRAVLDWRRVGFRPGVELASRYRTPAHLLRYPRYHVRIAWRDAAGQPIRVGGPIAIGGGRFCGFGLFAASET